MKGLTFRKLRLIAVATSILGISTFVALPANAAVREIVGLWINTDPHTRNIPKIEIREDGDRFFVHVWGACRPTYCDWGEAPAHLFSPAVGLPIQEGADAAIAEFSQRGITTMLLISANDGALKIEDFTIFADGDRRSDYHTQQQFVRP